MTDMLGLVAAYNLGVITCSLIVHRISTRWRARWIGMLAYFGIVEPVEPE
jgi:hypothetical protein